MTKTEEPKKARALTESAGRVYAGITSAFICVILAVFPLYYQNYYFDILRAKYKFYWVSAVIYIGICLIVGLVLLFVDRLEYKGANAKEFFAGFRLSGLKKLPMTHKMLALFWVFCLISTLQSDYLYEAFWGNEGRYTGLFLTTLYVVVTLLVVKFARPKKWHLDLFLLSSLLVCLFGITDYFRMDILGWKKDVVPAQGDIFTSTLGNVNTYTAYVAIMLGVCGCLFVKEEKLLRRLWYFVLSAIGFFAILTGQSDNAYLALAVFFLLLPFFVYKEKKGIVRYSVLAATFFTVIKLVYEISVRMEDKVIGFSSIIGVIGGNPLVLVLVAALWALSAGLFYWSRKQPGEDSGKLGKILLRLWIALIAVSSAVLLFILFDANLAGNAERYDAIRSYVVFDDNWGTNRGYCWRIAWQCYMEQPFMHKLFGYGLDTFGILTWDYREEALELYNFFFESAHNEYLQFLVTAGPIALFGYLGFLGSGLKQVLTEVKKRPWTLAFFMAPLCYLVQALVNINLPIATPIMWLLLSMGLAACRGEYKEEAEPEIEKPAALAEMMIPESEAMQ